MSKNKLTLIMMTLLTASALGGAVFAHAQEVEVDENKVAAENLLLVLSERENAVTSLFEQIVDDGGEVPGERVRHSNIIRLFWVELHII